MFAQKRFAMQFYAGLTVAVTVVFFLSFSLVTVQSSSGKGPEPPSKFEKTPETEAQAKDRLSREYGRLPMNFELNRGQAEGSVKFLSRGRGYQVFLTETEAALVLLGGGSVDAGPAARDSGVGETGRDRNLRSNVLRIKPVGAQNGGRIGGLDLLPGRSNYLIGNDPSRWQTEIPNYARVHYNEVYPGIDLAYHGTQQSFEYDFVVAPGADPGQITVAIEGADEIEMDSNGDLVLRVAGEKVYHRAPVSYQNVDGRKRTVTSRYVLKGGNRIGFSIADYDSSKPLVVDPIIDYSTFFGGIGSDEGFSIALDSAGAAYVTGTTYSNNFNTFAPLQTINRGGKFDAFITKINPAGSTIVYSTYLGGGGEDQGRGIAVDSSGNAYIAGITNSQDFNTRNPLQPAITGLAEDAFIAKINPEGTQLVFSTYLGGSNIDQAFAIKIDGAGDAYVAGSTTSADFITRNPIQPVYRGNTDVFVAKIRGDGSSLVYSTYLGGSDFDEAYGIALDPFGNAYVTGTTASNDYNTVIPLQPANAGGGSDAFVTKINAQGTALVYSTYVGGSGLDVAYGIAVDVNINAYITGHTFSSDYPVFNPRQDTNRGSADAFVSRLNVSGTAFVYSTYIGGSQGDFGRGIAVDANAGAYISGRTASTDFPTRNAVQPSNRGNLDAFVAKLNLTGTQLVYSTYLGGSDDDLGFAIAVDGGGNAFVTGDTRSTDFNARNPLQAANRGGFDAFVTKLNSAGTSLTYSTYLGGAGEDLGLGIAIDTAGNAYITGFTSSNDYLTRSPIQQVSRGGLEVFVTKILADASDIAFNTYFGGDGSDTGNAIAVDSTGSCYITGATTSTNLPTRTPIQAANRGSLDAFVAKLNAAGSNIIYSTYLGGAFGDLGRGIAVDVAGNAFVTGSSFSDDFPVQNAFQPVNRGLGDVFVARINPAGSALVYSSFLGGAGNDEGASIAVDLTGSAYVAGNTASTDFNTRTPLQPANRGQQDAFIAKVNSDGGSLLYSTYLGGLRTDIANGVAVDSSGNAYLTGSTASNNFPTQNALQAAYGGGDLDAYVAKINPAGSALLFSTYLGGNLAEVGNGITVDSFGNVLVTGVTSSFNFPLKNPLQADNRGGNDAFITKLNPQGTTLVYSTYLGGSNDDRGNGITVDSIGTAYVTGATASPNFNIQFPLLAYGGGSDVFVAKVQSEPSISLSPSSLDIQPQSTGTLTATISAPQTAAVTLALTSSNSNLASVPPSVTIPGGAISVAFTVTGLAPGGPVTITAALPQSLGGATAVSTVNVRTSNRFIQAVSATAAGGGLLTMPIELVSQGNENRLSFSVSLDPAVLLNSQFTLGSDAIGATLNTNLSQAGIGRFGITITLPQGQQYEAGTRQVLVLRSVIASSPMVTMTSVGFADQPTVRRVTDLNGVSLNTNYTPGDVVIALGYEGDVAPRPNGNNGSVTISDWVQTGRFAAGSDTAALGSEFQRADTSPRATLGNGSITISDWVQAGRYAAGLDPVVPAGGPTAPTPTASVRTDCAPAENCGTTAQAVSPFDFRAAPSVIRNLQNRIVRVVSVTGQRGQQVMVNLELDSLGNENAIGFSLSFNPTELTFIGAALGADASAAILNTNSAQAANGRVGIAMALPTGQTFSAGTKRILILTFGIPAGGTANTIPITFIDQPVAREIVNPVAEALPVTWTPGNVNLTRLVTSVSAASFLGNELASEQIVAAFGTSLATTTLVATTVPLPTDIAGTTVRVRDSLGVTRLSPLFFVAPTQINYQIPPGTANGAATVTITSGDGSVSIGNVMITATAPGIFSANATGQGLAAATVLRIKADGTRIFEAVGRFDTTLNRFVPIPIDLGPEGEQVFLLLFGTGARAHGGLQNVSVRIGGAEAETLFLGAQGTFVGLDQGNVRVPRSLAGRGEVNVVVTVATKVANTVTISIR
jgi:uncharacterized protein (TIGR03437 family)